MVSTDRGDLGTELFSFSCWSGLSVSSLCYSGQLCSACDLDLSKSYSYWSTTSLPCAAMAIRLGSKVDMSRGGKCRSPGSRAMNRFCKSPA